MTLQDRLRRHVDVLAELIGERNSLHPSNLTAARTYITKELAGMGLTVTEQHFTALDREATNLEVVLPGRNPNRPTLVIGAHYDSVTGTPGADDNASAVATLLEISRAIAAAPTRQPVRIVFYDCEEPPYFNFGDMGSQHHAAQLRKAGVQLDGMICLESLGYYTHLPCTSPDMPRFFRFITRLLGQRHVVIVSNPHSIGFGIRFVARFATSGWFPFLPAALPVRWVPLIQASDHRGYWEQGYRALMVTDTALLRNPNYHRASDRLATLDFARMTRLCRQLQRTLRRMTR